MAADQSGRRRATHPGGLSRRSAPARTLFLPEPRLDAILTACASVAPLAGPTRTEALGRKAPTHERMTR